MVEINLKAIGQFHGQKKFPSEAVRQATIENSNTTHNSYIELLPGHQFEQALLDLHHFSHIWVIYQFHFNHHWKPQVRTPRGGLQKRGVFSTRAPYRPNPIGISALQLIKIEGLRLMLGANDLLHGTPIIDIKPYLTYADSIPSANNGWLDSIPTQSPLPIHYTKLADMQLSFLEQQNVLALRPFLQAQLEYEPTEAKKKRVSQLLTDSQENKTNLWQISYRTWRVQFLCLENQIQILSINSGYSNAELQSMEDIYQDKSIHRKFLQIFVTQIPPEKSHHKDTQHRP